MPFTPAAAPLEPAPTPVVQPTSDPYHSQGYPPPQNPHTSSSSSHPYTHPTSSPSTHSRPYSHAPGNAKTRTHPHTAPPASPVLATAAPSSSSQTNSYRQTTAHPPAYEHNKHEQARPRDRRQSHPHPQPHQPPPPPPPPRSHEWRQTPASAPATTQAAAGDGGYFERRYADSAYTVRSPTPSDWASMPSDSVAASGQRQNGHHDSQSRISSPGRSYVGHGQRGEWR